MPSRTWLAWLLVAAALHAATDTPPSAERLLQLARAAGLPCETVANVAPTTLGEEGVSDCPGWTAQFVRGRFAWSAGFRADDCSWVWFGGPPLARGGRLAPLLTATEAATEADVWFRALGFPVERSEYWECVQRKLGEPAWVAQRVLVIAPETVMLDGAEVWLDDRTGALLHCTHAPALRLAKPVPPPAIGREEAVARALAYLRGQDRRLLTRLVGPPTVLRARRVFFNRRVEVPPTVRSQWCVDVGGTGRYLLSGAEAPRFWRVRVQEWDGAVEAGASERCSRRFVLDREVTW